MRHKLTLALGTAAALGLAAVAVAVVPAVVGVSEATATFSTTTIGKSRVRSCTADAKAWETTDGRYRGTVASSNGLLAGALEIHAHTTYNTTDRLGYVTGSFAIKDEKSRVRGTFSATIKGDRLVGFLTGKSHGNHARVLGNLSADFAGGTTNFANGQIGSSSSNAVLAIVAGPICKAPKSHERKQDKAPKKARHAEAKGEVTALSAGPPATITVTGKRHPLTCNVDAAYAIAAGFSVGTKDVEMTCEAVGDPAVWTLRKLKQHENH